MENLNKEHLLSTTLPGSGIVLIDRNRLFREGMKRLFESAPFHIVAESRNLEQILPELRQTGGEPKLLLIEWFQDDHTFLDNIAELNAMNGQYRIVALSDRMDTTSLITALRAGVQAFLMKDLSPDALIQSLRLVETGEVVFPTELAALLMTNGGSIRHGGMDATGLSCGMTSRELQILRCLVHGHSNKVIANQLNITEGTVKVHVKGLLRKIEVHNRTQAAIWALSHGLDHEHEQGYTGASA